MLNIFRALVQRVKNALLASAATEIEADAAARAVEQKAALHRQAAAYEAEGLGELARELRARAGELDAAKPLAPAVAATDYLVGADGAVALAAAAPAAPEPAALPPAPAKKAKKAKA